MSIDIFTESPKSTQVLDYIKFIFSVEIEFEWYTNKLPVYIYHYLFFTLIVFTQFKYKTSVKNFVFAGNHAKLVKPALTKISKTSIYRAVSNNNQKSTNQREKDKMMMIACFLIPNHDRFNTLSHKSAIYCAGFYDLNDMIKDLLINLICWDKYQWNY